MSSFETAPIRVLVCSTNVGNQEPTPESFAAWVPEDGNIAEVTGSKEDEGYFSIIVIGMQEALFEVSEVDSSSSSESDAKDEPDEDEDDDHRQIKSKDSSDSIGVQFLKKVAKAGQDVAKVSQDVASATFDELEGAFYKTSKQVRTMGGTQDVVKDSSWLQIFATGEDNECGPAAEFYGGDTAYLFHLVRKRLPSYKFVVNYLRGQMRLLLLVRNLWMSDITDVHCKAENTGLGQVLANKGGICATMTFRGTRLSFFSAHLAAHEGDEYLKARNESIEKILSATKVGPQPRLVDASLSSHYTFFAGDLNYRVRLEGEFATHEDHVEKVMKLVSKKDWKTLNDGDELAGALVEKDCLAGFQTPFCNFNPTFKLKREEGYVYNPQRSPSYTDRILWRSLDGLEKGIKNIAYHPCPGYITSDHKPIRGAFEITPCNTLVPSIFKEQPNPNPTGKSFNIFVTAMKCRDLAKSSSVDPYISFITNPSELMVLKEKRGNTIIEKTLREMILSERRGWPSTKTLSSTQNPDWGDAEIRLELESHYDHPSTLKGTFLYMHVFDEDPGNDDLIGTVEINLMSIAIPDLDDDDDEPMEVMQLHDRPILKYGKVRGYLSCELSGWWFDREVRVEDVKGSSLRRAKEKKKKKKQRAAAHLKLGKKECTVM